MSKTQKIKIYLKDNPIDDTAINKYREVALKFGVDTSTVGKIWKRLKGSGRQILHPNTIPFVKANNSMIKTSNQHGMNIRNYRSKTAVSNIDELYEICNIDKNKWDVIQWDCRTWEVPYNETSGESNRSIEPLFSISAKFKPRNLNTDKVLQSEIIKKNLLDYAPRFTNEVVFTKNVTNDKYLLELALFDVHFGKLAHKEESGEDYDLKISVDRFVKAVDTLLSRIDLTKVDRILFPIGNDMITVDSTRNVTTAGTPQDVDSRFHKIVKTVKKVLIDQINKLSTIAPVDVVVCVGNHDEVTSFMIGEMLECYYHNSENVTIINDSALRKYYRYHNNSFLFTHGNREKFNELGMIFAAENPLLWAMSKNRYIQIGHFHHNKLQVLMKNDFQGFTIQIIPSLSGPDAWHTGKGYMALKQAKAFLYHKKEGVINELTYTP